MEYLVLALFLAGVGGYIFWSYKRSGLTLSGVNRHFGLDAGDNVKYRWSADLDYHYSRAAQAAAMAAKLVFDAEVRTEPRGAAVAISESGLLVLMLEQKDGSVDRKAFRPEDGLSIEVLGSSPRKVQGGPAHRVRFTTREGKTLTIRIHVTAAPLLQAWAQGSRSTPR